MSWVSSDKEKEQIVKEFVNDAHVFGISDDVVRRCVHIRRAKRVKTPDAIIAATAIVHGFILVASDQGFSGITGLAIIDPHTLTVADQR